MSLQEAMYYEKLSDSEVRCQLCPRFCRLDDGGIGECGARKNLDGTLYSLIYDKISSIAMDPIEKKPVYHFMPGSPTLSVGTVGCNLRCLHCQNSSISHTDAREQDDSLHTLSPEELVSMARDRDCQLLVWTYNEPTIWAEYVQDSGRLAHEAGLKTVMVTAGGINEKPLRDTLPFVDVFRLDIKGFSKELYEKLTGFPFLKQILANGIIAREMGKHIEIVTNIIPEWNNDREQLTGIAEWIVENLGPEVPWHVTAYHPSWHLHAPPTRREDLDLAIELGKAAGLKHIFAGNMHHPASDTFCPECGAKLIERSGFHIRSRNIKGNTCGECGYELKNFTGA